MRRHAVIDNQSHILIESASPVQLTALLPNRPAFVDQVDWLAMNDADARRLRELGLCEGASIELLHRAGWFRRGAHACRIGRMTIAMRANHAAAVTVRDGPAPSDPSTES